MKKIAVIGSGFAGLAAATCLAKEGYAVTVFEKNESAGGRARKFEADGFTFDMGPSWYWMPDVFEKYFALFGKKPADYYTLERLSPSYRIFYGKDDFLNRFASCLTNWNREVRSNSFAFWKRVNTNTILELMSWCINPASQLTS